MKLLDRVKRTTDFLSIKSIVILGVVIMGLMITGFALTMLFLSSTIKNDQSILKGMLLLESQNREIIHTIKELNYIDSKILLSTSTRELEGIELLLLKQTLFQEKLNIKRDNESVEEYNRVLDDATTLINEQINLQREIYEKAAVVMAYENELNEYIIQINKKITAIGHLTSSIAGIVSLRQKRENKALKTKFSSKGESGTREIEALKKLLNSELGKITSLARKLDNSILKLSRLILEVSKVRNIDTLNSINTNEIFQVTNLFESTLHHLGRLEKVDANSLSDINKLFISIKEIETYILAAKRQMLSQEDDLSMLRSQREALNSELFTMVDVVNHAANEIKLSILSHSDNLTRETTVVISVVSVISLVLLSLAALVLITRINVPLEHMTNFIKKLSSKKVRLSNKLPVEVNDEFGELAVAFNEMTSTIDHNIHEIQELNLEIETTQREVLYTMGTVGEFRSKETGNHVKRVANYSKILAKLYGMDDEEAELLKMASPMHDIGKVAIPDRILKKPGRLDSEEFEYMKKHAELGYEMLKHSNRKILQAASVVAYEHHEKYDGTGYPRGLKGEDIHIYGRITAVADVFDALGSTRCYKEPWPDVEIKELFNKQRGRHFDPELVGLFFENFDAFDDIRKRYRDD